ncbi:MAG: glycosyltransferase family 4 protein [Promethearchaeota archaeon]
MLKTEVIYTIDGFLPSNRGGGPFRIVDYLLNNIPIMYPDLYDINIITKYGYFDSLNYKRIYSENLLKKPLRYLFKRLMDKYFYLNRKVPEYFDKGLLESNYLKTHKMMKKYIKRRDINKKIIIHSLLNGGAFEFLCNFNFDSKLIATYQSKGSIINDYKGSWNLNPESTFGKYLRMREFVEIFRSDIITFPSKAAFELMKNDYPEYDFSKKDVRIIYNGIDINKIKKIVKNTKKNKNEDFVILTVAQHVEQKNIDILLKALGLVNSILNFKSIIIGEGPLLKKHKKMANELKILNRIEFKKKLSSEEVIQLMVNADLFALIGSNVVFDLVVLEAMAVGLPLILSNNGGNLEAIKNGETGILVNINENELANAILFAYKNKDRIKKYAEKAKIEVNKKFSLDAMISGYSDIYLELSN